MNDETLMKLQNAEDRISSLLKLPPPHSSWSHQRTVEFKECCKKAMNYMNRKRKNLDQLVDLEKQIRTYF